MARGNISISITVDTTPAKRSLAKIAYNAYRLGTGGISAVSGDPLPVWEQLADEVQDAWGISANAVCAETVFRLEAMIDEVTKEH